MNASIVSQEFFDKPPCELAIALLGKVLRRRYEDSTLGPVWLAARIIETEAYERREKGSHSSLGFTEKRKAMFMAPGTIYMYYARGNDSLNFSARGDGNGVLVKAGYPHIDSLSPAENIAVMQRLNPGTRAERPVSRLCNGQTLVCRALNLKVPDWNQRRLHRQKFRLEAVDDPPVHYIQCRRLGIPEGRDEHLPYRFIDVDYASWCTSNPLTRRDYIEGRDYRILPVSPGQSGRF